MYRKLFGVAENRQAKTDSKIYFARINCQLSVITYFEAIFLIFNKTENGV